MKDKPLNRPLLCATFGVYLFLLIWIIALKFNAAWLPEIGEYMRALPLWDRVGKNIIPFHSILQKGLYFEWDYFMNVVVYLPMGLFLPLLLPKKGGYAASVAIIFFSSVLFEGIQLLTGFGGCDASDVVCNTLGGCNGLLFILLLRRHTPDRVINVINAVGLMLFSPVALFALLQTLQNLHLYRI